MTTKLLCAAASLLLIQIPAVYGQGLTGQISGNVTDSSGSPVANAEVTLVNLNNSRSRQARPDSNGDFVFTQLLPSNFRITVAAAGFKKYEQTDILLTATERIALPRIELQLGEITQTVEVSV